ncbi:GNAT family N-acetyltransferase [Paenibacillus sp. RUD330]|nr:GNAT family N-acetyltransferase [Paenibacillus sp. RUD330]
MRALQTDAYREEARLIGFDGIPQIGETHEALLASPADFYGCRLDGRLAGAVAVEREPSGIATIARLVVHPDFFRRGLGSFLVRFALSLYPDSEYRVSTGTANKPAVLLYLRFGFEENGQLEIVPGVWLTRLRRSPRP